MEIITQAHLDTEAISELRDIMEDDFEMLIQTFLKDSAVRVDALSDTISSGDAENIRKTAHSFKGSSSNIGALQLAELCRVVEQKAHGGDLNNMDELLTAIKAEYLTVKELLEKELL